MTNVRTPAHHTPRIQQERHVERSAIHEGRHRGEKIRSTQRDAFEHAGRHWMQGLSRAGGKPLPRVFAQNPVDVPPAGDRPPPMGGDGVQERDPQGGTPGSTPRGDQPTTPHNCNPPVTGGDAPPPPSYRPPVPNSDTPPAQPKTGKAWDVWFDAKKGTRTEQRSPIVLDLNGNNRADITGKNIKGDGKVHGGVKGFDLSPQNRQWENRSIMHRPGGLAVPPLPKGARMEIYDAKGKLVRSEKAPSKFTGDLGLKKGQRADFRGPDGKLVGELKQRDGQFQYHWGNKNQNEWTSKWNKNGGDGLLVWDANRDGKITSGKELMGTVDVNGKERFKNGYEKLAHYFDKDGDGVVKGAELADLQVWEDRNGDGITQKGELVSLAKHGITGLETRFNADDMSSNVQLA